MIPEYKLYHGAVLAELIDKLVVDISIGELREDGRLSAYILNRQYGLYVKHSAQRMGPWQFTFSTANAHDLLQLRLRCDEVYVVLVCWVDGMVCLDLSEVANLLGMGNTDQAWIRAERLRGRSYSVSGSGGELPTKKPRGLSPLIDQLKGRSLSPPISFTPDTFASSVLEAGNNECEIGEDA
jgi:hypothetical protein